MTRKQIKTNIKINLDNLGVRIYTESDLNESLQDAYDDIAFRTKFNNKKVTINWFSQLVYYNFRSIGLSDYMGTTAIFNNVNKRWLRDDVTIKDYDRLRKDWENWEGTPQFWAPTGDPNRIAITPHFGVLNTGGGAFNPFAFSNAFFIGSTAVYDFQLIYWAQAPIFQSDDDVPLVASDMHNLFEYYTTADMLESNLEFTKASTYWGKYETNILEYKDRVKRINKSDLLYRV